MVIHFLSGFSDFPDPKSEDVDELLAVGGDLRPERLLAAYQKGIFPWYSKDSPILWWSPDPRLVLFPTDLHIPKRLFRILKQGKFEFTLNQNFQRVIESCSKAKRRGAQGTWLVQDMIKAYIRLHHLGYAHSVEAWQDGKVVGGLYGVALGKIFFGESMFYSVSNASKAAFVCLVRLLEEKGFHIIDCQQTTEHLLRFGAVEISRKEFVSILEGSLRSNSGDNLSCFSGEIDEKIFK